MTLKKSKYTEDEIGSARIMYLLYYQLLNNLKYKHERKAGNGNLLRINKRIVGEIFPILYTNMEELVVFEIHEDIKNN